MPAQAGIHVKHWTPACAGATNGIRRLLVADVLNVHVRATASAATAC